MRVSALSSVARLGGLGRGRLGQRDELEAEVAPDLHVLLLPVLVVLLVALRETELAELATGGGLETPREVDRVGGVVLPDVGHAPDLPLQEVAERGGHFRRQRLLVLLDGEGEAEDPLELAGDDLVVFAEGRLLVEGLDELVARRRQVSDEVLDRDVGEAALSPELAAGVAPAGPRLPHPQLPHALDALLVDDGLRFDADRFEGEAEDGRPRLGRVLVGGVNVDLDLGNLVHVCLVEGA